MNLSAVYHEPKSRFAYAYDAATVHLRLRTAHEDVQAVTLIGGDPFSWVPSKEDPSVWEWDASALMQNPMQLEYSTRLHDYWFIALHPATLRMRYAFILHCGDEKILYGSRDFYDLRLHPEFRHNSQIFFNFPYLNAEDVLSTPGWVKDTVWYQIFPERFARGGSPDWTTENDDGVESFAGGNLQGIIDHLDDIQELGVTGLYLTPIFTSPSSHKYDTTDYYHIDPAFGSNEQFGELVRQAHQRGMRLMLDAVFNHCGWLHPFWQDVLLRGKQSPYYECFYIEREPVVNFEIHEGGLPHFDPAMSGKLNFRTFAFTPRMPKWNTSHPLVREHLFGAARYWMETYGVDGWRLDVSNEVTHDFWREFRKMIKGINPEAYIMGENWDNSYHWLMGDQFDAVMNYELSYPIWNLLGLKETTVEHFDVLQYQQAVNQLLVSYPKNNLEVMYNLIDSHDTPRIAHIYGGNMDKVKLAYLLLMTFTGAPSVYYGSEVGMSGDGHHNRAPYPWGKVEDLDLRDLIHRLILLRREHPSFKSVDIQWLDVNPQTNTMIFKKVAGSESLIVLVNASGLNRRLDLPLGLSHGPVIDLLEGEMIRQISSVNLPPYGFSLFLMRD